MFQANAIRNSIMNSSSIKNVQDELSRYKKLTLQSHQLIQSLINLVSQKTTINNDQNQKMIGDALNISTVFDATNEEFLELKDSINVVRIGLRSSLKKIVDMSMDLPNDSGYFDLTYFRTVVDNMKQQALDRKSVV